MPKALPTDNLAKQHGCKYDDTIPKRLRTFAKKYCGVDLLDWQYEDVIQPALGWRREDDSPRYRYVHLWMPKKSGKTFMLAILAAYVLLCSGKKVKIMILSGVKEQTDELWDCIENFCTQNKTLSKRVWFRKDKGTIVDRQTKSTIKIISSKGDAKSGFNADLLLVDEFFELHPAYARKTWDKIKGAGMARLDSFQIWTISHANYNHNCPAYDCWHTSHEIIEGRSDEWFTYALHYGVGEFEDWTQPENWWKALPACPEIVPKSFYHEEYAKSKDSVVDSIQFRTFYLNQLVSTPTTWIPIPQVKQCYEAFDESKLYDSEIVIGIDGAKSYDIFSFCVVAKLGETFYLNPFFAIPEKAARDWEHKHHVPYTAWSHDPKANLLLTPGEAIDYTWVIERIQQETKNYKRVLSIRYDPNNFQDARQHLTRLNIAPEVMEVSQYPSTMGPLFKYFETLVLNQRLKHNGNPVWLNHLSNCSPKMKNGRLWVDKEQDHFKVDGIDATCIGLSYWANDTQTQEVVPHGQSVLELW